jgi:ATP-dependent DNA helicase DinG
MLGQALIQNSAGWYLGEHGPLKATLKGFQPRPSQQEFALKVEESIQYRGTVLAESGTGTGKTFAYLVPALLSGKRVLISTGTRYLQEQLFHRDLPTIAKKLKVSVTAALLKGRANYLCIDRLEQSRHATRVSVPMRDELEEIYKWSASTKTGDKSEVSGVREDSEVWQWVTSTVDNCLGSKCTHFNKCHINKARKKAAEAELIVVNHHLFFADATLKEDGFGQLLPDVDAYIFDEAHQLPDTAGNFLGTAIGHRQIEGLVTDVRQAEVEDKSGIPALLDSATALEKAIRDLRLAMGKRIQRYSWEELVASQPELESRLNDLAITSGKLVEVLAAAADSGDHLERCYERAASISGQISKLLDQPDSNTIRWVDVTRFGFRICETPINPGPVLAKIFSRRNTSMIFTSATLTVAGDFSHFRSQMGLGEVDEYSWSSPFNFADQTLLYLPEGLPDPRDENYQRALSEHLEPIFKSSKGRAFMLFTSYKAMQGAAEYFVDRTDFKVLVQGDKPKAELLEAFQRNPKVLLCATMGFWEGVDVKGDALVLVMLDKLPFESPGDPVLKSRLARMEQDGLNPFMEYQLPRAVIKLRQGAGRLIRDFDDYGVLILADPRTRSTRYGKKFLESLSEMPQTSDRNLVSNFLASI